MSLKFVMAMILMVALAFIGYSWQVKRLMNVVGATGPGGLGDVVGVKLDLLVIGGAEQQQLALEGKYLPLADLRKKGVAVPERRGAYAYGADVTDSTFLIKATCTIAECAKAAPAFTIGPDMVVKLVK